MVINPLQAFSTLVEPTVTHQMCHMENTQKSATCCYCGAHTLLTLSGKTRHELKCTSCGAPLRRMKSLRKDHVVDPFTVHGKRKEAPKGRHKSRKKKKSMAHRLLDVAEDIFDIFD
jgi:dissimilatory sulfite reductase (desulfoviridin) alpha/beta subunit